MATVPTVSAADRALAVKIYRAFYPQYTLSDSDPVDMAELTGWLAAHRQTEDVI